MGVKKPITVGYWYLLGIHFGLCQGPVDSIPEIRAGGRTAWSGDQTISGRITIDALNLWGGEKAEGGIAGAMDIMMGEPTQVPNDYLASVQSGPQPAYRGVTTAVFRQGRIGAFNYYPKPIGFRVQRALKGWDGATWYPETAVIQLPGGIKAMNPAHMLYQSVTDQRWGQGEPRSLINDASFRAAADILFAEGFGLNMRYSPDQPIEQFQQSVIDHIAGAMTQSRADGLYYLDLMRQVDILTLPIIGEDDVRELVYEPSTLVNTINSLRVRWRDPLTNSDKITTPVQALGNITSQGAMVSDTRDYFGIGTEDLALRVAFRDMQASSLPLSRLRLTTNRKLWSRRPGQAIRLQLPTEGIVDVAYRIGEIDFGDHEDGRIRVSLIQDVFSLSASVYARPQATLFAPPDPTPFVSPNRRVDEANYRAVTQILSASDLSVLPPDAGFLLAAATRPAGLPINYILATSSAAGPFVETAIGDWSPTAVIVGPIGVSDLSFSVSSMLAVSRVTLGSSAIVDDEVMRVDAIDTVSGIITVGRGCADSVPVAHLTGARVWFSDDFSASDGIEYSSGESVSVKVLTRTSQQLLSEILAPVDSVVFAGRQARPYPPGKVRINGSASPASVPFASVLSITWAHRDRVLQDDQLIDHEQPSIGPEPGTTYTVVIEQPPGTVVSTQSGISGTSSAPFAWLATGPARVVISSSRGGLTSLQSHVREFIVL